MFISFFSSCLSSFRQEEAFCSVASSNQKSHRHAKGRDGISGPSRTPSIVSPDFQLMPWFENELKAVRCFNMCCCNLKTLSECSATRYPQFSSKRKPFGRELPKHSRCCQNLISLETLFTSLAICGSFHYLLMFPLRCKNVKLKVALASIAISLKRFCYLQPHFDEIAVK